MKEIENYFVRPDALVVEFEKNRTAINLLESKEIKKDSLPIQNTLYFG